MPILGSILSFLASLIERVGLAWLNRRNAQQKSQDVANAPVTNKEEADYWDKP